jgi:hypothetical protein
MKDPLDLLRLHPTSLPKYTCSLNAHFAPSIAFNVSSLTTPGPIPAMAAGFQQRL